MVRTLKRAVSRLLYNNFKVYHRFLDIVAWFLPTRASSIEIDTVFVLSEESKGWVLEAQCKEVAKGLFTSTTFHYSVWHLPNARRYFFGHYATYVEAYRRNPVLRSKRCFVLYTHPRSDFGFLDDELFFLLNRAEMVFSVCNRFKEDLVSQGCDRQRIQVVYAGADPLFFKKSSRGRGKVGFSTAYYERKDPDRILDLVKYLRHRDFVLLGRGWEQYPRFEELRELPNFEYIVVPYEEYPQYYAELDVFVSASQLEGGPLPLIETMMCNVVPVASNTGYAEEVITNGENGYIFEIDASVEEISALIEKAYGLDPKIDVRQRALDFSWDEFRKRIVPHMNSAPLRDHGT